jgi:hypothetical protein
VQYRAQALAALGSHLVGEFDRDDGMSGRWWIIAADPIAGMHPSAEAKIAADTDAPDRRRGLLSSLSKAGSFGFGGTVTDAQATGTVRESVRCGPAQQHTRVPRPP